MNLTKRFVSTVPQTSGLLAERQASLMQKFLLTGLLLIVGLFISSLFNRTLNIDEAILGEHAYWLAKEGKVRADLYAGTGVGWEKELLVYHKLFVWAGAGIISLFGLSLPLLRSLSIVFAIVLCGMLYLYCKNFSPLPKQSTLNVFLLCLLLLLLNSYFFAFSFIYRPEIWLACFGFGSFFALSAYLKSEEKRSLVLAAVLAGLATITHLNGLIYIGAGGILLFINRKYQAAFLFGIVAAVVSSLYAVNMISEPGSWERFLWQFRGDPAIEAEDLSVPDRLFRFFEEHKRYLHSYVEGAITGLFLLTVLLKGKYLWNHHRNLLLYPLICAFLLACISQGLTSKYPLLYLPQAILLIAFAFYQYLSESFTKNRLILVTVLLLLYTGMQLHHSMKLFNSGLPTESRNALIGSHIPEGSYVYANVSFFFNEVENFKISSMIAFDLLVHRYNKKEWSKESFFQHVNSLGCTYIVFDFLANDMFVRDLFSQSELEVGNAYYGFKVVRSENGYVIMKKD